MKKLFALLLTAMLCLPLAACGDATDTSSDKSQNIVGGWTTPESPVVSKEVKDVLAKATEKLTGATYEPVAYLGSQVVAGTNHLILCKMTPTTKDAESTYAIVTVYEDLEGNAEITGILNSKAKVMVTDVDIDGGWIAPETPEVTHEAGEALLAASEKSTKGSFEPVVLLGTQVVAGTNYSMLCEITPLEENAETYYAVVTVYQGADGTTSVLETIEFTAAE
ncbi:MAG: hypothetical protein IJM51_02915 [Clostridia bacterium]|nr:hypothetical protein [Clostridia bacterium]